METYLNEQHWELKGYWAYVPLVKKSMETGIEELGVTDWIKAKVPGSIHKDLQNANIIPDPYFENNSMLCEWVENRWWEYRTVIKVASRSKRSFLIFKGVDYRCHIYVNGIKHCENEGAFNPICFEITNSFKENENITISVLIENAPNEMPQMGFSSQVKTQKSRFGYKWDFCPRLVNLGIWDDVILKQCENIFIKEVLVKTSKDGTINFKVKADGSFTDETKVVAEIFLNDSLVVKENISIIKENEYTIKVNNPKLWYPNGYGEQPLYKLSLSVYENGNLSDSKETTFGFSDVTFIKNEKAPDDALGYTLLINEKKIYIKGVNLTPLDIMIGTVSNEDYEQYIDLIKNANINLIRIWGGGIIEKEYFYSLCDKHGIMIWQDFIQSSSGGNAYPSTEESYINLLVDTSVKAFKNRFNHVSLIALCGGNELMTSDYVPLSCEFKTLKALQDAITHLDSNKTFFASSPTGQTLFTDYESPEKNHDVHGWWKYEGPVQHYTSYNKNNSLFHSEFGADGLMCSHNMNKFLGEKNLQISDMKSNLVWRHHGEWWDTLERDEKLFGSFIDLEQFSLCSQFIQAESIRYTVSSNRRRKFQNSGCIVWQLNDNFPNVSCTSLVDYYKTPKMAYYYLKNAYSDLALSLKYNSIFFEKEFAASLYLNNSVINGEIEIQLNLLDIYGKGYFELKKQIEIKENTCTKIDDIKVSLPQMANDVFFVSIKAFNKTGVLYSNLYIFGIARKENENILKGLINIEKAKMNIEKTKKGYLVTNISKTVALFVNPILENGFAKDSYICIFPNESHEFEICNNDNNEPVMWQQLGR